METKNTFLMYMAGISLKGKWSIAVGAFLIYLLFIGGSQFTIHYHHYFMYLALLVIGGPVVYGAKVFALTISRDQDAQFEQIFDGFNRFGITFSAYIFMSIFILLWTLLLIIPGIIAAISYSMTFFILADDPNIGAMDAIDKSKQMMEGYKIKYFLLCLIFGLLIIACLFTLGIGFLWLLPYMHVTFANFYNDIKENQLAENVID